MNLNNITNTGTWGEQATRLNDNFNRIALGIDTLQSAYQSLSQSDPEVVDTLPQTGEANKIYRLVGTTSYSDYMYNADDLNTPILMATYNNGIDDKPTAGSNNLVKSGGVAKTIERVAGVHDSVTIPYANIQKNVAKNYTTFNMFAGREYTFTFENKVAQSIDIYMGIKSDGGTTLKSSSKGGEAGSHSFTYTPAEDYIGAHFYASVYENIASGQEFIISTDDGVKIAYQSDLQDVEDKFDKILSEKLVLEDYTYAINTDGKYGTGTQYYHQAIQVEEGQKYIIDGTYYRYCFATEHVVVAGGNIALLSGTNVVQYSGERKSTLITIPEGCSWLLMFLFSGECYSYDNRLDVVKDNIERVNARCDYIIDSGAAKYEDGVEDIVAAAGQVRNLFEYRFKKGEKYKLHVEVTYDVSRSGELYFGFLSAKTNPVTTIWNSGIMANKSSFDTVITVNSDYPHAYFYVSNYAYSASNKQYVTAKIENVTYDDRLDELESFESKFIDQLTMASNLGYRHSYDALPVGWIPQLVFLHISDTHANIKCSNDAIKALNLLSTRSANRGSCAKFLIHTGDIKTHDYTSDFTYWTDARASANKSVFHVVGNHDTGFHDTLSLAGTDAQVYGSEIEPFITEWNLTTTNEGTPHLDGKSYYFKDFASEKVRMIVLYEFESDMEVSESDNTKLKYYRDWRSFRQAQIDWLIDSLMTTPSDYGVIIAKHQMEDYVGTEDNPFSSYQYRGSAGSSTYCERTIIADIVQAFIEGTSINQSYEQTGNVVTTLSAVADFSQKNIGSEFICYLSGHTHCDSIHYLKNYPRQLELTIGCNNTNYCQDSDMAQIENTKTADVINVCCVNRNRGEMYVVRIGSDFSYRCQKRDYVVLDYRSHGLTE